MNGTWPDEPTLPAPTPAGQRLREAVGSMLSRSMRSLARVIVPPVCLACRRPAAEPDTLCGACWSEVDFIHQPICDRLGIPLPYDPTIGAAGRPIVSAAALADPPPYDRARAAAHYHGLVRNLLQGLKYSDRHELTRLFAAWLSAAGREYLADADVVVPVPLGRWRLLTRRYNQAALLSSELARMAGVRHDPLALVRTRQTPSQVGLTRDGRRRNVAGAFAVAGKYRAAIEGRHVVLVDDVVTTGATVGAATRALRRAGAREVTVLAVGLVTEHARARSP